MRLRTLLAAAATSALVVGALGAPADATRAVDPAKAGQLTTWGETSSPTYGPAIAIPGDLTGPVVSVAVTNKATGVVTLDGHVRVWGAPITPEWEEAPTDITDGAAIALVTGAGAVLHTDGRVTGWGTSMDADPAPVSEVPDDLRAKAIAVQSFTGYAVKPDGTLATWGDDPVYEVPSGLTDLVDISATLFHVLALKADGTVVTWGAAVPGLTTVPDFGGKKVAQITTGGQKSGVIFTDGTIKLWGAGALPTGEPSFDGLTDAGKVVSLGVWSNAAAVTADGVVHAWGANTNVTTVPSTLNGKPVAALAMGDKHVAAFATTWRVVTSPSITGTPVVGQELGYVMPTFSLSTSDQPYTWYADGQPLEVSNDKTTLLLTKELVDKTITFKVNATRGGESLSTTSAPVGPVGRAPSSTAVSMSPPSTVAGSTRAITASVVCSGGSFLSTGTVAYA